MKLIYFIPLLSTKGGQERTLIDKANYLIGQGHEVMFVTFENGGPIAYPMDKSIHHTDIDCHHFTIYRESFLKRFITAWKMKRQFRKRMSKVVSGFCPDVIVAAVPLIEFFLSDLMQVAGSIPVIIESHLARGYEAMKRGFTEKIMDVFYSPESAIRQSSLLVALTEGDAAQWRKVHHNVRIIANPVTDYPESLFDVMKDEKRIIAVGRLTPQKRFDRLIDAFAMIADKYPKWNIDIFGSSSSESREKLMIYLSSKGLKDRVHIFMPTSDIYTEYQRSEFFVLSSDFEGFGLVIVEAMACGIPVVSTDCPYGPSEIIEDGKTGALAKMDVQDLAAKMEWMITHEEERRAMGAAARKAVARYRKEIIMPLWEQAYLSVIK
jgi:glycosyltransferase involved in cell wall biosynthesis